MSNRLIGLLSVCVLAAIDLAAPVRAEPLPDPSVQPVVSGGEPAPDGAVPSGAPGVFDTPDGWRIEVSARDESLLPVAPLTTAISSREYLVGGTFLGTATGSGSTELTGGTLIAGYQIGCGVLADSVEISPSAALAIGLPIPDFDIEFGIDGSIDLLPGQISTVDVTEMEFDGTEARVTVDGLRINFDRCVGQSFIRSRATLAISTKDTEDVITYLGVTKIV